MAITRRQALGSGLAALGVGLARPGAAADQAAAARRRVLRIAHLTDCHIQPGNGERGLARCLAHLQSQRDAPTLILNTGDSVMDTNGATEAKADQLWALWRRAMARECSLPMESCLGNHDVWGTNRGASQTTGNEARWGKQRGVDGLGLSARYYSFDRAGWHFVALDDTFLTPGGYTCRLDDEQFAWLADDLRAQPKDRPVLIFSHCPIISVCGFFDGDRLRDGQWTMPGGWMHQDARELKDLFWEVGNVRLCLSGHMHQVDLAEFLGTRYYCGGAVSANWWNDATPNYYECQRGYNLVDLYDDGSSELQYVEFDRGATG